MFLAVTGMDPALTVDLSSQVSSGSKLFCGPDDNCDLLNNLIIHGDGFVPLHNQGEEMKKKRNRRKQKHGSRTTTHKKKSHFTKKTIVNAKHALISTMNRPKKMQKMFGLAVEVAQS